MAAARHRCPIRYFYTFGRDAEQPVRLGEISYQVFSPRPHPLETQISQPSQHSLQQGFSFFGLRSGLKGRVTQNSPLGFLAPAGASAMLPCLRSHQTSR